MDFSDDKKISDLICLITDFKAALTINDWQKMQLIIPRIREVLTPLLQKGLYPVISEIITTLHDLYLQALNNCQQQKKKLLKEQVFNTHNKDCLKNYIDLAIMTA